jgi:hypothetical protein
MNDSTASTGSGKNTCQLSSGCYRGVGRSLRSRCYRWGCSVGGLSELLGGAGASLEASVQGTLQGEGVGSGPPSMDSYGLVT